MSILPSTEELQQLLDEATPGPWVTVGECYTDNDGNERYSPELISSRADGIGRDVMWNTDGAVSWCGNPHDPQLAAHAPELAAEVIRMRKDLTDAKSKLDYYADAYHQQGHVYTSARLRDLSGDLTRILEGDQ